MADALLGVLFFTGAFAALFFVIVGVSCRVFGRESTLHGVVLLGRNVDSFLEELWARLHGAAHGFLYPPREDVMERLRTLEASDESVDGALIELQEDVREIRSLMGLSTADEDAVFAKLKENAEPAASTSVPVADDWTTDY